MRRAFFWSFAVHLFVLWLLVNEQASEADTAGPGLAVTIATRPTPPRIVPSLPDPTLPSVTPKLLGGHDTTAPQIRQPAIKRNEDLPAPVATLASTPLIATSAAVDADGLRRYRFALAREMRRAWAYPPQALTQKLEGTAEIRIELHAGGRFAAARIEKSSGYPVLDEAALKIISNAATAATVPSSLLSEAISIVQPVVFSVRGENYPQDN